MDISFDNQLQLAMLKKSDKELEHQYSYMPSDLGQFSIYLLNLRKAHPEVSDDNFEQFLSDYFLDVLMPKVFEAGSSYEDYMDLNSCKYLQSHSIELDCLLAKVSKPGYKPNNQPSTFQEYLEAYAYSLNSRSDEIFEYCHNNVNYDIDQILKKHRGDPDYTQAYKDLTIYIKQTYSRKYEQDELFREMKVLCLGTKHYLPIDQAYFEKSLVNNLTSSISQLISGLDEMGSYKKIETKNLKNLKDVKFPEFQRQQNGQSSYVVLDNLEASLRKLSIDDLMILNTFWLNRYIKELSNYADYLTLVREKHLLPQILSGTFNVKNSGITLDEFKAISLKRAIFRPFSIDFLNKIDAMIQNTPEADRDPSIFLPLKDSDEESKYVRISYEGVKEYVKDEQFISDYKKYFDHFLPESENNPIDEITFYTLMANPSIVAYKQKSDYLCALLTNIQTNPNIKNAGLIPTYYKNDSTTTLNLSKSIVGIGIDTSLTFPVREHIPLQFLKDFLQGYTGNTMIPIYEGANDFINPFTKNYSNPYISAQLVLPFTAIQERILKKHVKAIPPGMSERTINFIEHLYFLANQSKIPSSFITEFSSSKGKIKKGFQRKYVDLSTGEIFIKNASNQYEPFVPLEKGIVKPIAEGDIEKSDDNKFKKGTESTDYDR